MSFLSGWTAIALAAGLTVPPLVALYFLKLKRRVQPIPSTLLWKRAVQDLHVNSPFQRLRRNLLLLLQLLILLLAAFALGKPILEAPRRHEGTIILMIDRSASMTVEEDGGKTRLDLAKEQARRVIDNMRGDARVMIVSFCDRATIVSSFDTDRAALKAKINSIEPTESLSRLGEAMALAEAHASNLVIGSENDAGGIVAPNLEVPAGVLLFTDGRIEDAEDLVAQRFRAENMEIVTIGTRADNAGIVAMGARRHYERPEQLEVFAEVRNFGPDPVACDATLYINGRHMDVQSVRLDPGMVDLPAGQGAGTPGAAPADGKKAPTGPPPGSVAAVAFDDLTYEGGGVVEVRLNIEDALSADNRAWTVIQPSRSTDVLLVTAGNVFLERVLATLPIRLTVMTPNEYESAGDIDLLDGTRSRFDVVVFDRHSTDRLPPGNYFFWGGVPEVEGVAAGRPIDNEVIINWDETHPVLRHVAVESIQVYRWFQLTLPPEAVSLIDGETSPVLGYLAREGRQYLICAFGLLVNDEESGRPLLNTFWVTKVHFPMFMHNAIQYLSSSLTTRAREGVRPGEPVTLPVPARASKITIRRPDGRRDSIDTAGRDSVPYARTRRVGVYRVDPARPANRAVHGRSEDVFAVNLFSPSESRVAPNQNFAIGADAVPGTGGIQTVNKPIWPYLLLAVLVIVLLEWIIYNKRVFV